MNGADNGNVIELELPPHGFMPPPTSQGESFIDESVQTHRMYEAETLKEMNKMQ